MNLHIGLEDSFGKSLENKFCHYLRTSPPDTPDTILNRGVARHGLAPPKKNIAPPPKRNEARLGLCFLLNLSQKSIGLLYVSSWDSLLQAEFFSLKLQAKLAQSSTPQNQNPGYVPDS